jgi:hypothetical protein
MAVGRVFLAKPVVKEVLFRSLETEIRRREVSHNLLNSLEAYLSHQTEATTQHEEHSH